MPVRLSKALMRLRTLSPVSSGFIFVPVLAPPQDGGIESLTAFVRHM